MICRAKDCRGDRMPGSDYCGAHDEMEEDGEPFELKPIRKAHRYLTTEEKAQKWREIRERERLSKRRNHPEWKELSRRPSTKTDEELAAMYDARRQRDRDFKERNPAYACTSTRRAAVKDAALEVLADVKRKREERASKLGRTA